MPCSEWLISETRTRFHEMNHHPDVFISWGLARVSLITHSEHGITEKDFELAKKLDELA